MKPNNEPFFVGLTGGIGSGKSAAAEILRSFGAQIIDADEIARDAVRPGTFGSRALREEFGDAFFVGEELDRKALRAYAFSSRENTEKLDAIMRDLIRERMCERMAEATAGVTVCVVPLLFEAGWQTLFDEVWLICAFAETRIARVTERDGMTRENTLQIMNAQMSDAYKKRAADVVVNNNGTFAALNKALEAEYKRIMTKIRITDK